MGIYARVSTEEQARSGYSLEQQLRACREKAQTSEVIEYVDRGLSGEFLDRPALNKLRHDLREGLLSKVVCLDPDRLSRKLMNQLIVSEEIEKKVELVFVNGEYQRTPEGMLFYQLRGAIAEFEKKKITERMSRGRIQKARQGKVIRDYQIYGYDYDKEKEQLVINSYEASVVRTIFELFTSPKSDVQGINGIARYLTNQGIPTKRNAKQWHRQVVRQILMNKAYVGEFFQNRWNTEGMLANKYGSSEKVKMTARPEEDWIQVPCPKIIEIEQYEHTQAILKESRRRWRGTSKHEYLLSGLVRCAECGNTMTGRRAKNWGSYHREYTDVKNTAGAKNKGCGNRINCEQLDSDVWKELKIWLTNPKELGAAKDQVKDNQFTYEKKELDRICIELNRVKTGRNRLLNLLTNEDFFQEEDVRDKLKELKDKENKLLIDKHELETKLLEEKKDYTIFEDLLEKASIYYLSLENDRLRMSDKRKIIRCVIKEIRVDADNNVKIFTL
ncbi:recombinase family protein [Salipaludibacillus sp. CUR1]|uniref:recombinase family protein n=1 Tax=Salipaludibacillus sp. CUR1 TaxID=2820003 RepID=UPI001E3D61B2|nr:recombinase family protein [Salipaludibacillus sp. CUR1]